MFIFCLCDVGYWIRVNTVQKVKRKNMLPKYVRSFTAEVRTVDFFQVSSPFRSILRRNSEAITAHLIAFGVSRYTNILQIRSGVALHTNICPEIFFDHLKRYLSAFCRCEFAEVGLKFRVMAASVASSKFAQFSIITRYLRKPTA